MKVDLKYIEWYSPNGKKYNGLFIKTIKGYIAVRIVSQEFYEFPDNVVIKDAELNHLGEVKIDGGDIEQRENYY